MTELRLETLSIPAAGLGPGNPLSPFRGIQELHEVEESSPGIPEEMLRNMAYGRVSNILPYTMQDGYTRQRRPREFRVAVLENEFLRAEFLLELGGRLRSLLDKSTGRELLYVNPVFQPANLALRNAWFSGGVEWNVGTIAHCAFTCAPLFAARVEATDGTPVLRMYEWERIREVTFQIDAYLPNGARMLFIRVRIVNPHDREIPIYWWSNIAVPETPDTRVIVPADSAYQFGYKGEGLRVVPVPIAGGVDTSYSTNSKRALDWFYHIPDDGRRPWITALDGDGKGLIQVSTHRLKGRKLFVWGTGPGGKAWQEFLSVPGEAYLEIQAGLARTQMEHLPMPARAEWTWLEGYGLMEADSRAVHGPDWALAQRTIQDRLEAMLAREGFDALYERSAPWIDRPPVEILRRGDGWGALERVRREASGEPAFCSTGQVFDDESLTDAQQPWLSLIRNGSFPDTEVGAAPSGYLVSDAWRTLLERAGEKSKAGWLAWLHLGVMRYYAGDRTGARQAWEKSMERAANPWALRNLALLSREENRPDEAARLILEAHRLLPALLPLTIETGQILLESNAPQVWLDLLPKLPEDQRKKGRIRLLEGQAALAVGDLNRVERLLNERFVVDDLREGERSLSDLWIDFHMRRLSLAEKLPLDDALRARVKREFPVPKELDFRMVL